MKKLKIWGVISAVVLLTAMPAVAAEFVSPSSKTDANVSTLSQEVHKNLYVAGASVTVNSKTQGDLVAAGGMVTINGEVEKGLLLAGGNLNINAAVGDSARIGGGNVSINAPIGSDLVVGGGNVSVAQKATVGGDLIVGGGNVSVDADVKGNVRIGGGNVTINGKITGNVDVMASENLTFGAASQVLGKVTFKGPQEAVIKPGAQVGTIDYTQISKRAAHRRSGLVGMVVVGSLFKLLMVLVAGLVLAWLVPNKVAGVVREAVARPWPSLGIGVLVFIVGPILACLLMVTVVGIYLGLIVLLLYGLLLLLSSILFAFYTGHLIWGWYRKDAAPNHWRDLGVGAVVMMILGLIPIVGWIAVLLLWLISLGALTTHWRKEVAQD